MDYADLESEVVIASVILNVICIIITLIEMKREIHEYNLDKKENSNYFSDIWNVFDLIGITTEISNLIIDFILTYAYISQPLKILNTVIAILAIFFQMIANIKYLRISNKFSSLIQLLQKVIKDLRFLYLIIGISFRCLF